MAYGKFIIRKVDQKFAFNVVCPDGNIHAMSEEYETRQACENGIKSVMMCAVEDRVDDQT